jgi:hypothetical protein
VRARASRGREPRSARARVDDEEHDACRQRARPFVGVSRTFERGGIERFTARRPSPTDPPSSLDWTHLGYAEEPAPRANSRASAATALAMCDVHAVLPGDGARERSVGTNVNGPEGESLPAEAGRGGGASRSAVAGSHAFIVPFLPVRVVASMVLPLSRRRACPRLRIRATGRRRRAFPGSWC